MKSLSTEAWAKSKNLREVWKTKKPTIGGIHCHLEPVQKGKEGTPARPVEASILWESAERKVIPEGFAAAVRDDSKPKEGSRIASFSDTHLQQLPSINQRQVASWLSRLCGPSSNVLLSQGHSQKHAKDRTTSVGKVRYTEHRRNSTWKCHRRERVALYSLWGFNIFLAQRHSSPNYSLQRTLDMHSESDDLLFLSFVPHREVRENGTESDFISYCI